jgi:hypothetical protein
MGEVSPPSLEEPAEPGRFQLRIVHDPHVITAEHVASCRLTTKRYLKFPARKCGSFRVFVEMERNNWPVAPLAQFFTTGVDLGGIRIIKSGMLGRVGVVSKYSHTMR